MTLLLAARMIAARRSAELALRRARGASLWQLFWLGTRGAAVACVPAAALGLGGRACCWSRRAAPAGPAAWWPGLATLACAVAGPGRGGGLAAPAAARRRGAARRRWPWLPRVVFEVTACAAAVGGIVVFQIADRARPTCTRARPRCSSRCSP